VGLVMLRWLLRMWKTRVKVRQSTVEGLEAQRRVRVIAVVDRPRLLCEGVYGKECALAAVTRCVFCGRNVCAKHTHYVGEEYGDYCSECYDGLTTIDDEFDDDED
jgi:hypothetical protein